MKICRNVIWNHPLHLTLFSHSVVLETYSLTESRHYVQLHRWTVFHFSITIIVLLFNKSSFTTTDCDGRERVSVHCRGNWIHYWLTHFPQSFQEDELTIRALQLLSTRSRHYRPSTAKSRSRSDFAFPLFLTPSSSAHNKLFANQFMTVLNLTAKVIDFPLRLEPQPLSLHVRLDHSSSDRSVGRLRSMEMRRPVSSSHHRRDGSSNCSFFSWQSAHE